MLKLKSSLIKNSKKIDKFFDKNLPKPFGMHKKLLQAMRYATIGSGKKIRGFYGHKPLRDNNVNKTQ